MDINRTDLSLLASVVVLIEERSVSRAAVRLGLSQPAMSAQLARLRDIFGDPLLVQSGRKMVPTERAETLLQPLKHHLEELNDLVRKRAAFDPATSTRTFKIMAQDHFHAVISLPLAERIASVAPGIRLALLPASSDPRALWEALEGDGADFLITSIRLTPTDAIAAKLFDEHFVFAQRKGHARGTTPPDIEELCALDNVLISTGSGSFSGPVDELLKTQGRSRRVALSVPSFLLGPQAVANSNSVAILPQSVASLYADDLELFEPPILPPSFPVLLSWHPKRQGDPAGIWLKELCTSSVSKALKEV
jgi:DNA-binding transcriptional LysR family regulator